MILTDNNFKSFNGLKHELGNKYDETMYDVNLELIKLLNEKDIIIHDLQNYKSVWEELKNNNSKNKIKSYEESWVLTSMQELEEKYNLGGKDE